jgi:hypothetical protein
MEEEYARLEVEPTQLALPAFLPLRSQSAATTTSSSATTAKAKEDQPDNDNDNDEVKQLCSHPQSLFHSRLGAEVADRPPDER